MISSEAVCRRGVVERPRTLARLLGSEAWPGSAQGLDRARAAVSTFLTMPLLDVALSASAAARRTSASSDGGASETGRCNARYSACLSARVFSAIAMRRRAVRSRSSDGLEHVAARLLRRPLRLDPMRHDLPFSSTSAREIRAISIDRQLIALPEDSVSYSKWKWVAIASLASGNPAKLLILLFPRSRGLPGFYISSRILKAFLWKRPASDGASLDTGVRYGQRP